MLEREDLRQVRSVIKDVLREDHLDKLPDLFGREHHKHRGTHDLTFKQLVDAPDYIDNRQFITVVNEDEDGIAFVDLLGTDHQIVVTKNPEDITLSLHHQVHIYSDEEAPRVRISNLSDTLELDPVLQFGKGSDGAIRFTTGVDDSDSDAWLLCSGDILTSTEADAIYSLTYNYSGKIAIADTNNHRVHVYTTAGVRLASAGDGSPGSGDDEFSSPWTICNDGVHVYILETGNDRLQKRLISDLSFVAKIGSLGAGDDQFSNPRGICTDGTHLYIADMNNNRIQKRLCSDLSYVSKTSIIDGTHNFNGPENICTDGTYLYITQSTGDQPNLIKLTVNLAPVAQIHPDGYLDSCNFSGICVRDGFLYIINQNIPATLLCIYKYTASSLTYVTHYLAGASVVHGTPYSLNGVDTDGTNLYFGNSSGGTGNPQEVQVYTMAGVWVSEFGTYGTTVDNFHIIRGVSLCGTIATGGDIPYRAPILKAGLDGSYCDSYPLLRARDGFQLMEDGTVAATLYVGLYAPAAITASYSLTFPGTGPAAVGHFAVSAAGLITFGQNVGTTGSPTFAGLTLTGLTASHPVFTNGSDVLVSTGTVPVNHGGTGLAAYAVGDLLYASAAATLARLADVAAGAYLRSGGVTTAPLWSTLILPNAATDHRLVAATATNTLGELAAAGATGEYLSGVTGNIPAWATLNQAAIAGLTTGDSPTFAGLTLTADLTVPNGGTGASTFTDHGVLYGQAAVAIGATAEGATGQYLAGATGAAPGWATLNQAAIAGLTTADTVDFAAIHAATGLFDHIGEHTPGHSVTFDNTVTIGSLAGVLKGTAGVVSGGAELGDLDDVYFLAGDPAVGDVLAYSSGGWTSMPLFDSDWGAMLGLWGHRKRIDLPVPTANLTDFPVCIKINDDAEIGAACRADGFDIRFTASDGTTELDYERESFIVESGPEATGIFWVKTSVAMAGTYIWCYYGNAAATDVSTTVLPATGPWITSGNCVVNSPIEAEKVGGSAAWDSQVYSEKGYVNACALSFRAGATNMDVSMGLNSDPTTDASYDSIDYAWVPASNGKANTWDSGGWGPDNSYTINTVFLITYDGVNVKYYMDGDLKRTLARAVGAALYLDSSFHTPGTVVNHIVFGPTLPSEDWQNYAYANQTPADGGLTWGAEETSLQPLGPGDGPTFDHLHITNGATFGDQPRTATSLYRRYYHISLGSSNPGASGATWVDGTADTIGGWQLNAVGETIRGGVDVHSDWDGASDMKIEVRFQVNVNNTGGGAGDTVDLKIVARYMGLTDVAVKTQTVEVATIVGASAQFKTFKADFTLNWDEVSNVIEAGDHLTFKLNLETDTSEVDDVIINGMSFSYLTTHVGIENGDE